MSGWSIFIRQATALCFLLAVALALVLLTIKYEVQSLKDELGALSREIVQEREAIQVLHAEFAYRTQPDRLRRLASEHLGLVPVRPGQLATLATVDGALGNAAATPVELNPRQAASQASAGIRVASRARGVQR